MDDVAHREEIRLACVFNGGVSLAVWMGGVAHEINEFTNGARSYGRLLDLLQVRARADVISGTSAGGINGAALALAQVNEATDLSALRGVWAEQGRLETLLHKPFQGHPSSLLRGEDFFLPELTLALHRLASPWTPRPADRRPVDLTVTTTLLDGITLQETDSLGQPLNQHRHDVQLTFRRSPDGGTDDFCEPDGSGPRGMVVEALGLAARASAGFPVAFEPTLIPVDPQQPPDDRPDMARYASWRGRPLAGDPDGSSRAGRPTDRYPDRSRYAVDGGLLNNTPTQHALRAIERMPAGVAVDRVMMLVIPLPSGPVTEEGQTAQDAPTLLGMGLGLAASVTSTGNRTYVDELVRHNRRATALRAARRDVLEAASERAEDDPLEREAENLYPHYLRLRRRRIERDLAGEVRTPAGWSHDRVRTHLTVQLDAPDAPGRAAALPMTLEQFVDRTLGTGCWPWGVEPLLDVGAIALEYLGCLLQAWPVADHRPVHDARAAVHDALAAVRRVRDCLDSVWEDSPHLTGHPPDERYWRLRLAVADWLLRGSGEDRAELEAAADEVAVPVGALLEPVVAALTAAAGAMATTAQDPAQEPAGIAGRLLGSAFAAVAAAMVSPTQPTTPDGRRQRLHDVVAQVASSRVLPRAIDAPWAPVLAAATAPDPTQAQGRVARLLLWLHVASWTIGDELPTENTNPVRFLQVSAATANHFADYSTTVEAKLGGASLSRFSGFLKRSWRLNDWTWGRFDGSTALLRTLLTPARVRRAADASGVGSAAQLVDELLRAAWGPGAAGALRDPAAGLPDSRRHLLEDLRRRAEQEVAQALARRVDAPTMPNLAALLGYGRHVHVVHEELPRLAAAIAVDDREGANPRSRGQVFLGETTRVLDDLRDTAEAPETVPWLRTGLAALAAFDSAGIGREPLDEEMASDQLIRTAVTAAGVAATVVAGKRSGLGPIAPVTRAVKGAMLLPYWVTRGLTSAGGTARYLALLGLAGGGVLLVLALLGVLDGTLAGPVTIVGAGAFVAALVYGAMRTGSFLHGTVLTVVAGVLLVAGLSRPEGGWAPGPGIGALAGALILVAGLMLLGSLREPMTSPKVFVEDGWERLVRALLPGPWSASRLRSVRLAGIVVVVAAVGALIVLLVRAGAARADRLPAWFAPDRVPHWLPWATAAAVVAGAALATALVLTVWRHVEHLVVRWRGRTGSEAALARLAALLLLTGGSAALAAGVADRTDPVDPLEGLLQRLSTWVDEPAAPLVIGFAVAGLAAAATLAVILGSRGLRRWQRVGQTWLLERSSGPAGVAAGWSVVYGATALVTAALVLRWWPREPGGAGGWQEVWTVERVVTGLVVLAGLLLVVAPLWILSRARRTMYDRAREALDLQAAAARPDMSPAGQAAWLEAHGRAYSAVVRRSRGGPRNGQRGEPAVIELRRWADGR